MSDLIIFGIFFWICNNFWRIFFENWIFLKIFFFNFSWFWLNFCDFLYIFPILVIIDKNTHSDKLMDSSLLLGVQIVFVALAQCQEALMPKYWHVAFVVFESAKRGGDKRLVISSRFPKKKINDYLIKWLTTPSTARYGSAYFLSIRARRKTEFAPVYSISAICNWWKIQIYHW